jgi:hypothetical protein
MNIAEFDKLTGIVIELLDLCKLVVADPHVSKETIAVAEEAGTICARLVRNIRWDAEYEAGVVAERGGPYQQFDSGTTYDRVSQSHAGEDQDLEGNAE